VTSPRRSLASAVAAVLVAAPALAGCAAGFDANTGKPYAPTEAANVRVNGIDISQAFILGPDPGGNLPQGGSAPLYLSMVNLNESSDSLAGATAEGAGTVKLDAPVSLPSHERVSTGAPTPKIMIEGLAKPLYGGESVRVNLQFTNAGTVPVSIPVVTRSREFATLPPAPGAVTSPPPSPTPTATEDGHGTDHSTGH
jgi:copper(I)-binding protein